MFGNFPNGFGHQTCPFNILKVFIWWQDPFKPPGYDPQDIVAFVERYGDAHISGSGWRPVDPEEWFSDGWELRIEMHVFS